MRPEPQRPTLLHLASGVSNCSSVVTGTAAASSVSKPLQLDELLRLLGGVLDLLRWSLTLLGRRPFGNEQGTVDSSSMLFRRLCLLLDFLEDLRELRFPAEQGPRGNAGVPSAWEAGAGGAGGGGTYSRPTNPR